MTKKFTKGISLIEILVVIIIFAVLGILTTRSIFLTLQGSKKSESLVKVRENLNYSMGVIERQLRNANSIVNCTSNVITYLDQNGNTSTFSCVNVGNPNSYVASGSARLTSNVVGITGCNFTCILGISTNPPLVNITIEGQDAVLSGIQNSKVSTSTQIYLRNY